MANLGSLFYSLYLKDMTDADISKIKAKLEEKLNIKIGVDVSEKAVDEVLNKLREKGKEITKNSVVQQAADRAEQTSRDIILKQLEREGRMWSDIQAKKEKAMQPVNQALSYSRIQSAISLPYESASYQNAQNQLRAYYQEQERMAKSAHADDNRRINDLVRITSAIQRADNAMQRLSLNSKIGGIAGPKTEQGIEQLRQYIHMLERAKSSSAGMTNALNSIRSGNLTAVINQANRLATEQGKLNAEKNRALALETRHKAALDKTNASLKSQYGIVRSLQGQITNMYSIYTLERFATQLIEIGGEFQKQHIALQSILGDGAKADAMFSKIKNLAIESPFTFQQLAGYTKQLAAFQIPYEELYDTTKRLADVSAGLGVDMGRIILAYGQVRSAAFLRGQEVRQFTEAGIPLLDELAKKFSQLENRVVSVGEVFDKISNREVPFEMVKEVFTDLTNEGGKFYNMQAKLSDSLSGKLAKLKDAYQIMLADIAQANNSLLGGSVDMVRGLISNWNGLMNTISYLIAAYGTYRAVMTIANITRAKEIAQTISLTGAVNANTIAQYANGMAMTKSNTGAIRLLMSLQKLKVAFQSLGSVGWAGIILSVIAAFGTALYTAYQNANRLKKKLEDIASEGVVSVQNEIDGYSILVEKLKDAVKGSQEYKDIIDKIQSRYGAYLGNIKAEADAYEYLHSKINEVATALRAKAMESARERSMASIEENYSEDIQDAMKDIVYSFKKDMNLSDAQAKEIASVLRTRLQEAIRDGLSPDKINYNTTKKQIENIAKEIGIVLQPISDRKKTEISKGNYYYSGGISNSVSNIKELVSLFTKYQYSIKEVDDNLKLAFKSTTAYGIQIEKLEKAYNAEMESIPIEAISRRKTAYLQLLEAKKSIYKDFGQKDEAMAMDVEIANVARLEKEWKSLSKEKFSAYSYISAKNDESEIDYVERLQKELASLEDISTKIGTMSPEAVSKAKEKSKLIREYLSLYGISAKGDKAEEKEADKRKKVLEKLFESLLSLRMENQKDEISLMKDGTEKELRQIDSDYEKQKNAITKKSKELARANKEAGISEVGISGLTDEQQKEIDKALELNESNRLKRRKEAYLSEANAMRDYLKEYGSIEQKKLAITELYEDKIAKARTKGERLSLEEEKRKTLLKLSFENISMGIDWKSLFSGVDSLSKEMIKPIMEQLISYTQTDDYKTSDSQTQRDIAELIQELRSYLGTDKSMTWQSLEIAMKKFTASVDAYNRAVENEKEVVLKRNQAKLKLDKGEITQKEYDDIVKEAERLGKATVEAKKSMNGFASVVNNTSEQVKNFVSGLSAALNNATSWKGVGGFGDLQQSIGNIDKLKGSIDSVLPSMVDGMGKSISESLSSTIGSGLSSMGKGLGGILSSGLGQVIGFVAQIPKLILEVVAAIKNFVTGIINSISEILELRWIDDLINSVLEAIGNLIDTIFDLPENIYKVLESIIVKGIGGLLNTVIGRLGNIFSFGALSSKGPAEWFMNSNAEEVAEATERLTDSNERLKSAVDNLKDEMSKSGGWKAIDSAKQAKEDQEKINKQTLEILKTQMGYHGAHHSNAYYWALGLEDYASINKTLADYAKKNGKKASTVSNLTDIYGLTPEEMDYIRTYNIEMWEKMLDQGKYDKGEYWENYADLAGELEEITESLKETLTQTSFDSLRSSFIDALMDMDKSAEDFANDFSKYMMRAILNARISDLLDKDMQDFYNKWAEYAESDNELTSAEQESLSNMWQELTRKGLELRDQIAGFTGYKGDGESTSGMSKVIKEVTEDTVNIVASYLNGIRQDVSVKRMLQEKFFNEEFPKMNAIAQAQLQQLNAIAESTRRTAESNDAILKEVSDLRNDVHSAKQSKDRGFYFH